VLISDVSSVALDFLYLRPERPIVLTDRLDNEARLHIESPLSLATEVITPSTIDKASDLIGRVLQHDENLNKRATLRGFYFDNVQTGQSTERFFAALADAINAHRADLDRARELARRGTAPALTPEARL
jgi:CDP-glycerol glycerophosphotransferase (TagB/SpsB family)